MSRDRTESRFVWGKFHLLSLPLCLTLGIGVTYPHIFSLTTMSREPLCGYF